MKKMLLCSLLLGTVVGCEHFKDNEADEGNEVKMPFTEVPAAVQKTITDASGGAKVATVDKEMNGQMTVYEADAMIEGKNYEIRVDEQGKLLSRKIDEEK